MAVTWMPGQDRPAAAANNKLAMMSGERYWVIVDFKGYEAGKIGPNGVAYSGKWLLKNTAKTPYPAGAAPQGTTAGPHHGIPGCRRACDRYQL